MVADALGHRRRRSTWLAQRGQTGEAAGRSGSFRRLKKRAEAKFGSRICSTRSLRLAWATATARRVDGPGVAAGAAVTRSTSAGATRPRSRASKGARIGPLVIESGPDEVVLPTGRRWRARSDARRSGREAAVPALRRQQARVTTTTRRRSTCSPVRPARARRSPTSASCSSSAATTPGARMLIVRKTRVSLTETALVTWERDVLGEGHPMLAKNLTRGHRHDYKFDNGSVLVTGGMDNPDKILSSEWDLIYVPEATDLDLVDWETLGGRLRANAGPYDQLFGDCNPTTPGHWLYKRCQSGKCKLYSTTHYENPRYYDALARKWTEAGRRYIGGRLQQMTGHRRDRFLKGLWVAAEGLVYDGYNPDLHLLPRDWEPPVGWPRLWSLDWGFNPSPIVLQFWALDPENRMYLYRETYRTRQTVADLATWAKGELESGPRATADHRRLRPRGGEGRRCSRRRPASTSSRPRSSTSWRGFRWCRRRSTSTPPTAGRASSSTPTPAGTKRTVTSSRQANRSAPVEELTTYVWDTRNPDRPKDVPLDLNDHGMDAMLYARRWVVANLGRQQEYDGPRGEDLLPEKYGKLHSATGW